MFYILGSEKKVTLKKLGHGLTEPLQKVMKANFSVTNKISL